MMERNTGQATLRGLRCKCPNCGQSRLFSGYLKNVPQCEKCGEDFTHHRADDLPPYLTIVLVGHIVVPIVLWATVHTEWQMTTHMMVWPLVSGILALLLLPLFKGATIGLQWAQHMHGF